MSERPNILIVMTDHQRSDTIRPDHPCQTPNIDRLAGQGVTFTNTYCPSPHCCPARATFHTGLMPTQHGIWNNVCNGMALNRAPADGVRLFSQDLADAGYETAIAGKLHVSSLEGPADRGWKHVGHVSGVKYYPPADDWAGYRKACDAGNVGAARRGPGQILRPGYGTYTTYGTSGPSRPDETTTQFGVDMLDKLAEGDDPWCMFLGLVGPHDPYCVPQKYLDMYDIDAIPLPAAFDDTLEDKPRIYQRLRRQVWGQLTEREVRDAVRHFWAYCTYLDDLFGRVLKALDETGQAENTVVLYLSDHGDYCGEHGLFCKGIPAFRSAYHVPAVVRWPAGLKRPGRCEDAMVSLADFAPTFLDMAGIKTDRKFAGRSLRPFLADRTPDAWRDEIVTMCNGVELYYTQRAVMTAGHKYVFNGFDEDELYDLTADPDETVNRAADPAYEGVKRDLCRRFWRFARDNDDAVVNDYVTVGLFPYGPATLFEES